MAANFKPARFVIAGIVFSLVLGTTVFAQQDVPTESPSPSDATSEEIDSTQRDDAEAREQRKQERKDKTQTRITDAQEARVSGRCVGAQTKLQALIKNTDKIEQNRQDTYANLDTKLDSLVARLALSDVDTSELITAIEEFDALIVSFFETFDTYQLALSDAAENDCEADTEGFLLALQDARSMRADLRTQSREARAYLKNSIKQILQDIGDGFDNETTEVEES